MNRPATVKLTKDEWISLTTAVVADIGADNAKGILQRAIGDERANLLIEKQEGPQLSKADNRAIVKELYAFAPGDTREEKVAWAITIGKQVFGDGERFSEILDYVEHRVAEHEADGGTIDNMPPEPEAPAHPAHMVSKWWGGVNMSGATVDPDYALTVSADGRSWSEAPASWRSGHAGAGGGEDAVGCCCCSYQRADGSWAGGKYEWLTRPVRRRSYENIKAGYKGWEAPASGTPILLWVHTADSNRVSTPVEVVWP